VTEEVKKASGERAEPPGCAVALIAFLVLAALAMVAGAPIGFSLALAVIGAVISGAVAMGGASSSGTTLAAKIEARKQEALNKNLWYKAGFVAMHLGQPTGNGLRFVDNEIEIITTTHEGKRADVAITWIGGGGRIVFESSAGFADVGFAEKTIHRPIEDGGFEVAKEYIPKREACVTIIGYIPGRWEGHLQNLEERAELERAQARNVKAVQEAQRKIQTERDKFGL
jgi:hypothetical protein